jgi:predicted nucleic acid-binding protein
MLVITDSTPLISLEKIGQIELIPGIYPEVVAPPSVIREIGEQPGWLMMREVADPAVVQVVREHLDLGEAEAIALALQHPKSILLMDERRGRIYASRLKIPVVGTLGILIEGKRRGLIKEVRPHSTR